MKTKLALILLLVIQNLYSQTGFTKLFPEISVQYPNNFILIDNGIVAIGTKDNSMYIANIDSTNQIVWDKKLQCEFSNTSGRKLVKSSDTTFICLGNNDEKIFIAKLKTNGDTIWTKSYSGLLYGSANDLLIDSNNNILVCGYTNDEFRSAYKVGFLLKLDSNGDSIYFKSINEISLFNSITELNNGYLVAGAIQNYSESNKKVFIANYNSEGDTIWTKQYGEPRLGAGAYSVDKTNDNNFLVAGTSETWGTSYNECYILKINQNGDTLWTKTYGYQFYQDIANFIKKISDTTYIVVGKLDGVFVGDKTQGFYSILNSDGEIILNRTYYSSENAIFHSAEMLAENTYLILGSQGNNLLLIKSNEYGGFDIYNDIEEIENPNFLFYPNPAENTIYLRELPTHSDNIDIFDVNGQLVYSTTNNSNSIDINISNLQKGIYLIRVKGVDYFKTVRFIKK